MRLNSIAILLPSFTLYQNAARKGRTGFAPVSYTHLDVYKRQVYPTVAKAQQAIIKYCEDNGFLYEFTADDEVVIDGIKHERCV